MSTLYLVATPIGNLDDLSPRARQVLQTVGWIACEDTRVTGRLLHLLGIQPHPPLLAYHDFAKNVPRVLEKLAVSDGALVSDAGTPGINDPGYRLVRAARAAGHQVRPIPGPSAPIAALAASGLPTDAFLYLGYLPRKAGEKRALLDSIRDLPYTLLFLVTPHRLQADLAALQAALGDREASLARELTKLHEEIITAPLSALQAHCTAHPPRGEITLVVRGASRQAAAWDEGRLLAAVREGLSHGEKASALAKRLATESGHPRRQIYALIETLKGDTPHA